jgi:hypothetical protein
VEAWTRLTADVTKVLNVGLQVLSDGLEANELRLDMRATGVTSLPFCKFGADCTDCKTRHNSLGDELCSDDCSAANNGLCEDGGEGAIDNPFNGMPGDPADHPSGNGGVRRACSTGGASGTGAAVDGYCQDGGDYDPATGKPRPPARGYSYGTDCNWDPAHGGEFALSCVLRDGAGVNVGVYLEGVVQCSDCPERRRDAGGWETAFGSYAQCDTWYKADEASRSMADCGFGVLRLRSIGTSPDPPRAANAGVMSLGRPTDFGDQVCTILTAMHCAMPILNPERQQQR